LLLERSLTGVLSVVDVPSLLWDYQQPAGLVDLWVLVDEILNPAKRAFTLPCSGLKHPIQTSTFDCGIYRIPCPPVDPWLTAIQGQTPISYGSG